MAIEHLFAGLPVADLNSALGWYERFLGRAADGFPNELEAVWQVTDTGLIYVVTDEARAGTGMVTLMVDDLEEHLHGVTERGITTGAIETALGRFRKVTVSDPVGNVIQVGQALGAA